MHTKFELDEQEQIALKEFLDTHKCYADNVQAAIGDRYTYHFVPSGIGTFVSISCPCGERKTLSDLDKY